MTWGKCGKKEFRPSRFTSFYSKVIHTYSIFGLLIQWPVRQIPYINRSSINLSIKFLWDSLSLRHKVSKKFNPINEHANPNFLIKLASLWRSLLSKKICMRYVRISRRICVRYIRSSHRVCVIYESTSRRITSIAILSRPS